MNYKKVFKRETRVIAYVVLALTLVAIGSSYALFMQVKNNTNNQIVKAGSLEIEYSSNNDVSTSGTSVEEDTCLNPMNDSDGKTKGCHFTLSITNTGTLPMEYDLLIYDNIEEIQKQLPGVSLNSEAELKKHAVDHQYLKHRLTKQVTNSTTNEQGTSTTVAEAKKISDLTIKNDDETVPKKRILESSYIQPKETIAFDLRIWIDSSAPEEIIGKYVYLKLDVSGVVYEGQTATSMIEKLAASKGTTNQVEKFTHTDNEEENEQIDYRYVGKDVDNYVYFGCGDTEDETCGESHLYRIIGSISSQNILNGPYTSRVKIVKDTPIDGTIAFNEESYENSALYKKLNEEYWDTLKDYQKYISPAVSYVNTITGEYNPNSLYSVEKSGTAILEKIGLLTPSDYGYSLGNANVDTTIAATTTSWLKGDKDEWLLTMAGSDALSLKADGTLAKGTESLSIRPCFFLNENVLVKSGTGTKQDPYKLEFR